MEHGGGKGGASRAKDYKKTLDPGAARKEKERAFAELRKDKRKGEVLKRRKASGAGEDEMDTGPAMTDAELQQLIRALDEGATAARTEALRRLRRALSAEEGAPIARALSMGLLERLARVLGEASAEHRMEAAWICTNIATGTHEETAAVAALSPQLIALVASGDAILQEQGAWALGNIAGDSVELRDKLRAEGAAPPLIAVLRAARSASLVQTASWALTNLVRGPRPRVDDYFPLGVVPAVAPLAINPPASLADDETQEEVAWLLSYLTAGEDGNARQLIDAGVVSAMVARVADPQRPAGGRALTPLLRALGNVASGPAEHVAVLLHQGPAFLEALRRLLASEEHRATAKEAAWIVSNVTGTGPDYADAALGAGLLPPLAHLLSSAPFDVKREAAFAVANLGADGRHAVALVQAGCLPPFLQLLRAPDAEIARAALSFVHMVLERHPRGPRLVEEADGIDAIESLQMGQDEELARRSAQLVDRFFGEDYDPSSYE